MINTNWMDTIFKNGSSPNQALEHLQKLREYLNGVFIDGSSANVEVEEAFGVIQMAVRMVNKKIENEVVNYAKEIIKKQKEDK